MKHKYFSCLVCNCLQRITAISECFKISLFDAIAMLAASWNAVSQETITDFYQRTRFHTTVELHNEEKDDLEERCSGGDVCDIHI